MNLNKVVKQFIEENEYQKLTNKIIILRRDGICVYSNIKSQHESASMGALMGGLWQAGEALLKLTHKDPQFLSFRLGFDTSSDGLYILPLKVDDQMYFLGGVFSDKNNPAKLKQQLRLLKDNLEMYLGEHAPEISEEKRDGFLFNEISDEEMDNLFSFGGV